jgi:hypothetical protein
MASTQPQGNADPDSSDEDLTELVVPPNEEAIHIELSSQPKDNPTLTWQQNDPLPTIDNANDSDTFSEIFQLLMQPSDNFLSQETDREPAQVHVRNENDNQTRTSTPISSK